MSYVKLTTESDLPAEGEAKEFEIEGRTICVANVGGTMRPVGTTSFGVRPEKELCGLKPLYSSLNNRIFSFAFSSERNQLMFRHSSRMRELNDST